MSARSHAKASAASRLLSLAAILVSASAAGAAEIHLEDGRVIEGEVISAAGAELVEIKASAGGMTAIQRFPASQVVKIVEGPTARQQALADIAKRRAALGAAGTADEWWSLALAASRAGDAVTARDLAAQVVARDRSHPEAHKLLGQVRSNGVWMRPNEVAVARGFVRHDGKWMSWEDRESAIALAANKRQEMDEARKRRIEQAREAANVAAAAASTGPIFGAYRSVPSSPSNVHVVYWPTCQPVQVVQAPQSGLTVQGAGGGSSFRWAFNWHL